MPELEFWPDLVDNLWIIVSLSVKGDSGAGMWLKANLSLMCSHEGEQLIRLRSYNLVSALFISYP